MWNLLFAVVEASLHQELTYKQNVHDMQVISRRGSRQSVFRPVVGVTGLQATTKFIMNIKKSIKKRRSSSQVVPVRDDDDGKLASVNEETEHRGSSESHNGAVMSLFAEDKSLFAEEKSSAEEKVDHDVDADVAPGGSRLCCERTKQCCLTGGSPSFERIATATVFELSFLTLILINTIIIVISVHFPRPECGHEGDATLTPYQV